METLPFNKKFYGNRGEHLPEVTIPDWAPQRLQGYPRTLADFVKQTLVWKAGDRITAATAKRLPFLEPRGQKVRAALAPGKNSLGSICDGELAEDFLQYLHHYPSWPKRLLDIHNDVVATQMAEKPLLLPSLTAVLAEARRCGVP